MVILLNAKIRALFTATISIYSIVALRSISISVMTLVTILAIELIRLKTSKESIELLGRRVALDLRGAVAPLATSTLMSLWSFQSVDYPTLFFLISLAIALSTLNTMITDKFFAINIVRYVIPYFILTSILCGDSKFYPHVLPLATQLGIIIGSDILHGIYFINKTKSKMLIIGGAGEYDAIYVSTIAIEWLEVFRKSLTTFICSTKIVY